MKHLAHLTHALWLMEPNALENLIARLSTDAVAQRIAQGQSDGTNGDEGYGYQVENGVARIPVQGVLMKDVPWYYGVFGIQATSYRDVTKAISDASDDPSVRAILLDVDSPGGSADGIHAMADAIMQARSGSKPVMAHTDGDCCSGAYWMASQASEVTASRGAQVGSIGAYTARIDATRAMEQDGIKVQVFSSGKYKGAGAYGTALTDAQKTEIQANIDALCQEFVCDVARGRGISSNDVQPSADGRVWSAADAQARGLIDRISSDPAGDYTMAADLAAQKQYLKSGLALCAEFPKHVPLINAALEKDVAIDVIRGDIAVAEKASQDKAEKDALVAEVAAGKVALKTEQDAHAVTKTTLANVQRERDALAVLKNGAAAANAVQSEPVPKTIKKITQADFDKMELDDKVLAGKAMAAGELLVLN